MNYYKMQVTSPVGQLTLIATEAALCAVLWENDNPNRVKLGQHKVNLELPILLEAERQLLEYFSEKRRKFSLKLAFKGTEFQNQVWKALQTIPFGQTRSYSDLAKQIGRPKAQRAVGAANRVNPIAIIIPCHRVLGANGTLTGFAGGLATKAALLNLECKEGEFYETK